MASRKALHGVKWPSSNPKVLRVDFAEQAEVVKILTNFPFAFHNKRKAYKNVK